MASLFARSGTKPVTITPDWYDRLLSAGAVVLLVAVVTALIRGQAQWNQVPPVVWAHLLTILTALVLTPWMLLRRRGTPIHRALGKVWVIAMFATAAISFFVTTSHPGHFSPIHILSVVVVILAPRVWLTARAHNLAGHRATVRGLVTGALLIAGFFTFPFNRLLGHWLFG